MFANYCVLLVPINEFLLVVAINSDSILTFLHVFPLIVISMLNMMLLFFYRSPIPKLFPGCRSWDTAGMKTGSTASPTSAMLSSSIPTSTWATRPAWWSHLSLTGTCMSSSNLALGKLSREHCFCTQVVQFLNPLIAYMSFFSIQCCYVKYILINILICILTLQNPHTLLNRNLAFRHVTTCISIHLKMYPHYSMKANCS